MAHSVSVCEFCSSGDIISGPLPLSYLHGFSFPASVNTCSSLFSSITIASTLLSSVCFHHSTIHSVESSPLYISSTVFSRVVERGKACASCIVRRSAISTFFHVGRPLSCLVLFHTASRGIQTSKAIHPLRSPTILPTLRALFFTRKPTSLPS